MFADKQTVLNAFRFRHACKSYDVAKKILADDFAYILETARLSPSSFGLEPWRFLVVQNRTLREELRGIFVILLARTQATMQADYQEKIWGGAHGMPPETIGMMQKFFKQFAETNFAIADNPRAFNDWATKQTYIALANMMTAAALIGVDSTPMEGFQKENVEKLLSEKGLINLDEYRVSVMAAFGYRTGEPKRAKTRQTIEDIVDWIA